MSPIVSYQRPLEIEYSRLCPHGRRKLAGRQEAQQGPRVTWLTSFINGRRVLIPALVFPHLLGGFR